MPSACARGGEPEYVFNEASQQRRIRFGADEKSAISDAPVVVVSCFAFDDAEQTAELTDALREARVPVAIDPNPRSGMLRDEDAFVRGFERLAAGATLVKVGEDDATLLYRQPLDWLRERLVDLGVAVVLATEGAAGATLESGDVVVTAPVSALPGRIVDTMGAGDAAFAAAVEAVLDREPQIEEEWAETLKSAMDAAAATCRFEGALLRTPAALNALDMDRLGT
nr:hypothetical protein GCM10025699_16380 [Microbacterium flavescens]